MKTTEQNACFDRNVLCILAASFAQQVKTDYDQQRKFWTIQDLLLGEGTKQRSPDGRPH